MKSILIVDDDYIIALGLQKRLQKQGLRYFCSAFKQWMRFQLFRENQIFDLIIMDIDLGKGIDGTEAAKIILSFRALPIIFASSYTEEEVLYRIKEVSGYGFLQKNSPTTVYHSAIEMAINLFNTSNHLRESEGKYKAAFMTSPDAVNINALDGRYLDINEGFTKLTGFTREDVIGKLSSDIKIWTIAEDREKTSYET